MTYTQTRWNLNDLFSGYNSPDMEAAFDNVEELVTSFEGARGSNSSLTSRRRPSWRSCGSSEHITRTLSKLYAFAGLSFAADTQDQAAQTLQARVDLFAAEMSNRTLFFSLWWKELNDQDAKRLLDAAGDYRYYLEEIRHFKPHTLSEPEEKIINIKNVTGVSALNTLYDAITNRYMFKLEVGGETKELTAGELMAYRYSPDPDVRGTQLPGAVPRLRSGWADPGADVPDGRARLAQRKPVAAQVLQRDRGAEPVERHSG